ncbi:hypothetical protein QJS10_CPA08g00787 [Acorus calamus]|uniref:Uncharacterized protein n=1 Tax=Acorus calamus TaxID=4465 RepID=A0AAV9EA53_ACOCL|nr:hypothetical protein QJS10_CPA08g00787 [Acorus calamus]
MDYPIFISTSLGTHLAVVVSDGDTVDDVKKLKLDKLGGGLKEIKEILVVMRSQFEWLTFPLLKIEGKIRTEYSLCFSNTGEINICSVKVKRKGFHYHLSDSMLIKSAFDGIKGSWFLYIDVESKSLRNNQVKFLENVIESSGVQLQTPALNEREHGTNNEGTVDFHVTCSPSAAHTDYGIPPVSPTTAPNSSQHELVGPAEDIPKKDSHTRGQHKEKSERKKRRKHKDRHEDISTKQGQSKAPEFVKAATESISVVPSEKKQKEETSKGKRKLDTYAVEDHGDIHAKAQAQSNQDHPTNDKLPLQNQSLSMGIFVMEYIRGVILQKIFLREETSDLEDADGSPLPSLREHQHRMPRLLQTPNKGIRRCKECFTTPLTDLGTLRVLDLPPQRRNTTGGFNPENMS